MVLTLHDSQMGVQRLLSVLRDLPQARSSQQPPINKSNASGRHRQLFAEYERALAIAVSVAVRWWDGILKQAIARGLDHRAALRSAYLERPAGPASCPDVVWVVRKFWLDCEAINKAMKPEEQVPPQVLVLGWLVDGQHEEMVRILSGMPYWPIGLNEAGEWV